MKAKIVILVLLLSVSQAFAFGDRERSALLGFVGGVVATTIYQNHNTQPSYDRYDRTTYYEVVPTRVVREYHERPHKIVRKEVVREVYYSYDDEYNYHHRRHNKGFEHYHRH